ncbi:MAG: hypothetical protein DCF22_07895 [Leptolyngbya sp.]|nr:MAG: hypothetical protein DCF22_07895 [Leptolyngbya sp.]
MDRIKTQANRLWQLISNPSTAATYQQTLGTTWAILKETGLLLWLVVCLVFVLGDWFWQASYATGQKTRIWIDNLQASTQEATTETSGSDLLNKTGQSLLSVGQTSFAAALAAAKGQLGIEATPAAKPIGLIPPSPEAAAPAPISPIASTAPVTPETSPADAPEG